MSQGYSVEEMMTVAISRELRNDDVAFIGLGTGGRAFVLAVGIPTAACQLARLTHAPGLTLMLGPIINPDPAVIPGSYTDSRLIGWRSEAQIPVQDCLDCFQLGKITVSFVSGAQVDRYGNINIVAIGGHSRPRVRLVGPIAQPDHMASPARNVIVNDLSKRTFVERVDFVSGVGYVDGPGGRERKGLPGQGPWRVVTNFAVFKFDEVTKQMALLYLFPGVRPEEVAGRVSFSLLGLDQASETDPPSEEELRILRQKVDPHGFLLQGLIM